MHILQPIAHETIWGGKKLLPFINENLTKLGHLYSLVSNGEFESKIINGNYKGKTLKEYFEDNKQRLHLSKYKNFPFVIALVDPLEDLSIQVHPTDEYANKIENKPFGKNESWYFIEPPKNGWLYNGCKAGSIEEIKEKIQQDKVEEDVIDKLTINKGDYVFVEQGTMHAATHGALFYEIEENCNLTYRFYDYKRKDKNGNERELHIEKALATINPRLKSKSKKYNKQEITERFYTTKLLENETRYTNTSKTIECLTILQGKSNIDNNIVQTGSTIILEPNEQITLNPSTFIVARPNIGETI